ncbi:lipocalin family protein [Sphingomonas sp. KRR8]|uniref:lipocalin family protein n=1 Tax=Sphingomonas sp. KRR8 TaxID=2942996 RepID=UPI0020221AC5|nr:lipocalin family protein [Sphingomonas sp. KRR8]URD60334.1 lipocalin family protein [Sphingomonas sp. KRR8]
MKNLLRILVLVFLLGATSALAGAEQSWPLMGSWAVDVSRLPMPPEARPKSVTLTFSRSGDGRYHTLVRILAGDGSERTMTGSYTADGTPYKIEGDTLEADTAAVTLPTPDVMVLALAKNGTPASTRVYALQPGGEELVETAAYVGDDGKPLIRTNVFRRVRR